MKEVRNKQKSPVQLILKLKKNSRAFGTKNLPGVGGENGQNVYRYPIELHTEYIDRLEQKGMISVRDVTN